MSSCKHRIPVIGDSVLHKRPIPDKMTRKRFLTISFIILSALLILSCNTDPGLEPTESGISGTITFTGDWPENTDEITVVAATKFPPSSLEEIVLSEPLPLGKDSVDYVIYHPPLDFAAVGVVWKEKDQPWDVTNIIGIYFPPGEGPGLNPANVSIPDKNTLVSSINITAELDKAKPAVDSYITGTLTVEGEWPANATTLIMWAAKEFSNNLTLTDIIFGNPMPVGFHAMNYSFKAQPGSYHVFGALVLVEGEPISFTRILQGLYVPALTNPIKVETDTSLVKNIDITLLF